jgi:hypothetical protein
MAAVKRDACTVQRPDRQRVWSTNRLEATPFLTGRTIGQGHEDPNDSPKAQQDAGMST